MARGAFPGSGMQHPELEYVGFWLRVVASIIDTILVLIVTLPLLLLVYGQSYWNDTSYSLIKGPADFVISWLLPAVAIIWFWTKRNGQTPGKAAIGATIVDADTGEPIGTIQAVIRYLGYFVSTFALMIGFIWVGLDPKKRGFHDLMASTVVVRKRSLVAFDRA